ncbi:MAG: Spy/CpxP family protein refolding chaperone [Cyanobacteria bacterium]|nr:Spy/CpxP family protein refolding chaperone [Cyanobacteriota bacterium]
MKFNKTTLLNIAALTVAPLTIAAAFAADDSGATTVAKVPSGHCGGGQCGGGFKSKLNLSDDQLERLNSLKMASREASAPKVMELKSLHSQLKDKLTKGDVNKSELLSLQSKINSLKGELANSRISFLADASAVLTADQRQQLRHGFLMRSLGGGRHHGKGFHGGRGFHGKGFQGKSFHGKSSITMGESAAPEAKASEPAQTPSDLQG